MLKVIDKLPFVAAVVPGSTCLTRDGQPCGAETDEDTRIPTQEEANAPLLGGSAWNETDPRLHSDGSDLYPRVTEDGEMRR